MTPNDMTKTQLLALVKVLRAFVGQYAAHTDDCPSRHASATCRCGFTDSMKEVSDAIEGRSPAFISPTSAPGTNARAPHVDLMARGKVDS